jgi:hypothetical protein
MTNAPRWFPVVAVVAMSVAVTGCGAATKSAPARGFVSWPAARHLLQHCRVKGIEQTHARLVTLKLRSGRTVFTHEPRIDDMFRVLNRLPRTCRPTTVATE